MSDTDARREALETLVNSDGWLIFRDEARKQWGPEGYGRKIAQAVAASAPADVAFAVGKIHASTEEINLLMKWPDEELKRLAPKEEPALSMHRGGR